MHRAAIGLILAMAAPAVFGQVPEESPASPPPQAAEPAPPPPLPPDRRHLRLFERFIEDAVVTPAWVEIQYRYENLEDVDTHRIWPVFAFGVTPSVEAGLRFGYIDVESGSQPEGSGLSDMEVYLKGIVGEGFRQSFAIGGLLKIPTAEETEGLGTGEADFEFFAAWRWDYEAASLTAHGALRYNGAADTAAGDTENTFFAGGALLMPVSPRFCVVIEATFETAEVEGMGNASLLTMGLQAAGKKRRAGFRASVGVPLSDAASDLTATGGFFVAVGGPRRPVRPVS